MKYCGPVVRKLITAVVVRIYVNLCDLLHSGYYRGELFSGLKI